jgi:hypothetical protein
VRFSVRAEPFDQSQRRIVTRHKASTGITDAFLNNQESWIVVQFGKISHFVRDDRSVILFVISSECEKSFPIRVMPMGVKPHHYRILKSQPSVFRQEQYRRTRKVVNSVCRKHQFPRFRNSENVKGFTPGPTHATNELRAALQLQSNSCTLDNLKHIIYDN